MMRIQHDDVACRVFPHTLENKVATWYHSLHVASIQNWDEFRKTFLKKFTKDKTPSMLLTELSNLNMSKKQNFKEFNQ